MKKIGYLGFLFFLTILTSLSILWPNKIEAYETQKTVVAVKTEPPIIDGQENDACWEKASWAPGSFWNRKDGTEMTEKTIFKVVYDEKALYVFVYAFDSKGKAGITVGPTEDGWAILGGDALSIAFFQKGKPTTWFAVGSGGGRMHQIVGNRALEPGWEAAVTMRDNGWTAEFKIPWTDLNWPKYGKIKIGFGCDRRRQTSTEFGDWCYIGETERPNNTGFLEVEVPQRKVSAKGFLDYTIETIEGKKGLKVDRTPSGNVFFQTQNIAGMITENPLYADVERDVQSIAFSYLVSRPGWERRKVFVDRSAVFYREELTESGGLFGASAFNSLAIPNVDSGFNIVRETNRFTFGGLGIFNRGGEKNHLVVSAGSHAGIANFGARFVGEKGKNDAYNIISLDNRTKGEKWLSWSEIDLDKNWSPKAESLVQFVPGGNLTLSLPILYKKVGYTNPLGYEPTPPIYGIAPSAYKRFSFPDKALLKEFSFYSETYLFNLTEDNVLFRRTVLVSTSFTTKPLKRGIDYSAGISFEGGKYLSLDNKKYNDKTLSGSLSINPRGQNQGDITTKLGRVENKTLRYFSLWGQWKIIKKFTLTLNTEVQKHKDERAQNTISLNYSAKRGLGMASRLTQLKIKRQTPKSNIYFTFWYIGKDGQAHFILGSPNPDEKSNNKEKFVRRVAFKLVVPFNIRGYDETT